MLNLVVSDKRIPPMSAEAISNVRKLDDVISRAPQIEIVTSHVLHAGMYARTIHLPTGAVLTGALVKIATMLIVTGNVAVYLDGEAIDLHGYNVFAASAHRKQAFLAKTDTYITMIFPSSALTIAQAEEEFTDEAHLLFSRNGKNRNQITITGE